MRGESSAVLLRWHSHGKCWLLLPLIRSCSGDSSALPLLPGAEMLFINVELCCTRGVQKEFHCHAGFCLSPSAGLWPSFALVLSGLSARNGDVAEELQGRFGVETQPCLKLL